MIFLLLNIIKLTEYFLLMCLKKLLFCCLQNYIARFGHGSAKLARQAQSKEKTLAKMVAQGLTEKVTNDKTVTFYFPSCGSIPPPVIMVQVSPRANSRNQFYNTIADVDS